MFKRVMIGALFAVLAAALPVACSSSKSGGSGGGGSAGASGSGNSGGSAGSAGTDGGSTGGSGGIPPYQDADLDAPYQLPDGGCGQIFCPAAVAASCPKAFQSLNDCANFCTTVAKSSCASQWDALLTCVGANPKVQCSSTGQISFPGCDSQSQAFQTCFSTLQDAGP